MHPVVETRWSAELSSQNQSQLRGVEASGAGVQAQKFPLPVPLPTLLCPLPRCNIEHKPHTTNNENNKESENNALTVKNNKPSPRQSNTAVLIAVYLDSAYDVSTQKFSTAPGGTQRCSTLEWRQTQDGKKTVYMTCPVCGLSRDQRLKEIYAWVLIPPKRPPP